MRKPWRNLIFSHFFLGAQRSPLLPSREEQSPLDGQIVANKSYIIFLCWKIKGKQFHQCTILFHIVFLVQNQTGAINYAILMRNTLFFPTCCKTKTYYLGLRFIHKFVVMIGHTLRPPFITLTGSFHRKHRHGYFARLRNIL